MNTRHRISFDLSKPVKFLGLTKDELGLVLLGPSLFVLYQNKLLGFVLFLLCFVALGSLKKFKKLTADFNILIFLWWHLGGSSETFTLVPSDVRRIG